MSEDAAIVKAIKVAEASAELVMEQAIAMVKKRTDKGEETLDAIYAVSTGRESPVSGMAQNELFKMLAKAMPSSPPLIMVPSTVKTKKKAAAVSSRRKVSAKGR